MKKALAILLSVLLAAALCACGSKTENDPTNDNVDEIVNAADSGTPLSSPADNAESDTTLSSLAVREDEAAEAAAAAQLDGYDVDIDLVGLNKNMTTAQVQAIMQDVTPYLGKTIRITGLYEKTHYDETGLDYNYIIGYDDTGCCAAWSMEFRGDAVPDNLVLDSTVSMVGKINTYDELGMTYTVIDVEHFAKA